MLQITEQFKDKVVEALLNDRANYEGSAAQFSKRWGISDSVFSRLKKGEREKLLKDSQWLNIGRGLDVTLDERKWNVARTDVFNLIEESIEFCKNYSKAMIFVDEAEIGKSFAGRYLSRTLRNCFYVDASQCKTRTEFVCTLAKTIGIDSYGRHADVKANIKYYLRMIERPIVIIDEPGDLEYAAFLEIKEFWNATENICGWFLMGADGVRKKIDDGMKNRKVGYREIFSRFSGKYLSIVPNDRQDRLSFYKQLITDVLSVNVQDKSVLPQIVKKCLISDQDGNLGGLRRAESLLIMEGM